MPSGQAPWMPPSPVQKASRATAIIAVVVSLLALALAAAAFFKPQHDATPAAPQYSDQQVADAKKNVCDAYNAMDAATRNAGGLRSDDPNQKFMISINTRLAFNTAADHLLAVAEQSPAGPSDLLAATKALALAYQKIVLAQTAEAPTDTLERLYTESDNSVDSIKQACG